MFFSMTARFLFPLVFLFRVCRPEKEFTLDTSIGQLQGILEDVHFDGNTKHVVKFLGIPYALPPLGDLRFRKPIPTNKIIGNYNATFYRPSCPQTQFVNKPFTTSEDCLYLNVFVPLNAFKVKTGTSTIKQPGSVGNASLLAVMVWIHGGAYLNGGSQFYDGSILSTFNDVIIVTINYRLNIFGFLSTHDAAAPGNYGLWDQHLAIKWVNNYIRAFMGDHNRVTIFGQSAGSAGVLQQTLYPGNKGLFQTVIAESGSPFSPWAISKPGEYMDEYTRSLASVLGCSGLWSQALVACLRTKSQQEIINKMGEVKLSLEDIVGNILCPVVDGEFFTISPIEIYQNTHVKAREILMFYRSLNVLTGINSDDGALFIERLPIWGVTDPSRGLPRDVFETKEVPLVVKDLFGFNITVLEKAIIQQYTDWAHPGNKSAMLLNFIALETDIEFLIPAVRAVNAHAVLNSAASTYFYVFSHQPSAKHVTYMNGANHDDELSFVFGFPPNSANLITGPSFNLSREDVDLSKLTMTMWTNFAKTGDPNKPVSLKAFFPGIWPRYDVIFQSYIDININMTSKSVKQRYAAGRVAFWEKLVPAILKTFTKSRPNSAHINPSNMLVG